MSRIVIFSHPLKEKLQLISLEKIKHKKENVLLVVVTEDTREKMEKLEKQYGFKTPVNFRYYMDYMQESSDERYLLKENIVSSKKYQLLNFLEEANSVPCF